MNSKLFKYLQILALSSAGATIYLIPYIRYVFYDYQIAAMDISNQQIGLLTTIYTVGTTLLMIPGGILADKSSTKRCIILSLLSTSILTFIYAFNMGYGISLAIWFLLSFSTVFVFWGALMKTIRLIGGEKEQGFMYGLYYMGNGLFGAAINGIAVWVLGFSDDMSQQFFYVVMIYGISTTIAAAVVWFLIKEDREASRNLVTNNFDSSQIVVLLKSPVLWIFSVIIFAAFMIFSSNVYFTPYLTDIYGVSPEQSGILTIFRTYVFYILAPVSGLIADKVFKSTSRWFVVLFAILALLYTGVIYMPENASSTMVSLYSLLPGIFSLSLYGIVFSIASETKIPASLMATAAGIASVIGFSPDLFSATLFGHWLDLDKALGYHNIFLTLALVSVLGMIASFTISARARKLALQVSH